MSTTSSNRELNLQALTRQSGFDEAPFFDEDHPLTDTTNVVAVAHSDSDYGATLLAAFETDFDALKYLQQFATLDTGRVPVGAVRLDMDPKESMFTVRPVLTWAATTESVYTYC